MMRMFLYVFALSTVASAFVPRELRVRQALEPSDVPSECTSTCAPLFSKVQTCGSLNTACLCTSTVRNAGIVCADCIASVLPSTLQSLQSEADKSVETCQQEGHIIAPVTIVAVSPTAANSEPAAPSPTSPSSSSSDSGTGSSGGTTNTSPKSGAYGSTELLRTWFGVGVTMSVALFVWH